MRRDMNFVMKRTICWRMHRARRRISWKRLELQPFALRSRNTSLQGGGYDNRTAAAGLEACVRPAFLQGAGRRPAA
eukprot:4402615-Amphidinium_carterae.3